MATLQRCNPDDPHRCQSARSHGDGRCPFLAAQDPVTQNWSKFCARHNGTNDVKKFQKDDAALYALHKWDQRVAAFGKHSQAKSLTAELAVLRLLLENKLQQFQEEQQLALVSGSCSDLVVKIEKLVLSIHKIDRLSGLLMDRPQIEAIATKFVEIISQYITDPDDLEDVVVQVNEALNDAGNPNRQIPGSINNRPPSEIVQDGI